MTTVLVTGAAGFIGSHVAEACRDLGFHVVGLDDLSGGFVQNIPAGVDFVEGSVCDEAVLKRLFSKYRFDYVYHLAAYAAEGLSHFIRAFNYQNNVIGSVLLINEAVAHQVKGFVFTSSIAVYGAGHVPMREEMTPEPEDPYGIAKYAVELDLEAAARMFGLPFVVFRPHNVYGERQNIADRYRNVVGIFMNQVMRGEPMTIFGDGQQTRAFSYIGDVAPMIARAPLVPAAIGETFNVGGDVPCSVLELARALARTFGVEPAVRHLPARKEVVHAFASHDRAHAVFGDSAPTSIDAGLARMASWVKSVGPMAPGPLRAVEVDRNLPPSWVLPAQNESLIPNL